jgi:hypothetical protein
MFHLLSIAPIRWHLFSLDFVARLHKYSNRIAAAAFLLFGSVAFAEPCNSFRDTRDRSAVDFAPLDGFVDVCSSDFQLCVALTQGYPPSVKTICYFVPVEEWQHYQKGERSGFSRYLIGQRATTMSQTEFVDFKHYIHEQDAGLLDHTKAPATLELQERMPLGIIEETDDSISFGAAMRFSPAGTGMLAQVWVGSINIILQLKGETLCLYAFDKLKTPDETDSVQTLAKRWLNCIRARNP